MIHWMIQVLMRLAPDTNLTEEAVQVANMTNSSIDRIVETSKELIETIEDITKKLVG